jgi:hypothetical protein
MAPTQRRLKSAPLAALSVRPRGSLALAVLCLLAFSCISSRAAQAVGGVRVVERPIDGGIQLCVENSNLAAVTLTLNVTAQGASIAPAMPRVLSCSGKGVFPFAALRPLPTSGAFTYKVRYDWRFGHTEARHAANTVYHLPFRSGKMFTVVQGAHGDFTHTGNDAYAVDFAMPVGTPIHAAREGVVEVVLDRFSEGGVDPRLRDRVNLILIRHPDGTYGEYVHLRHRGARVRPGEKVKARQLIGLSGNTGYSKGPHLHFAVFRAVDGARRETFPLRFIAREGRAVEPIEGRSYTAP